MNGKVKSHPYLRKTMLKFIAELRVLPGMSVLDSIVD